MRPTQILIVDSDPTAAFVTQHGLQRLLKREAKIEIAASAGEARARCLHEPIDLLIIDPASVIGTAARIGPAPGSPSGMPQVLISPPMACSTES